MGGCNNTSLNTNRLLSYIKPQLWPNSSQKLTKRRSLKLNLMKLRSSQRWILKASKTLKTQQTDRLRRPGQSIKQLFADIGSRPNNAHSGKCVHLHMEIMRNAISMIQCRKISLVVRMLVLYFQTTKLRFVVISKKQAFVNLHTTAAMHMAKSS